MNKTSEDMSESMRKLAAYYIGKTMSKFANPDGFTDGLTDPEEEEFWMQYEELMAPIDELW